MNLQEFDSQVNRLRDTFGDRSYPDERVKIIWREVQSLGRAWFERTIDRLIGEFRKAPMLPDIRFLIAEERERHRQTEKLRDTVAGWQVPVNPRCSQCW